MSLITRIVATCAAALVLGAVMPASSVAGAQEDKEKTRAASSLVGADYRIGPGDVIAIDVFALDELDFKVRVLPDGSISLPLIGTLRLGGMTPSEAEQEIERQLTERRLVKDPQVTIVVEELVSQMVTVLGAVESPGEHPLVVGSSLLEVIADAGGFSSTVGPGQEIVIQRGSDDGAQLNLKVRVEELLGEGKTAVEYNPMPGDVVMVPHSQSLQVFVTGAVANPGSVQYESGEGITILQAITAAGGPNERANSGKVHIIRRRSDGTQERIDVDVRKIQKGKAPDLLLERGDTIVVGEWFF